MTTGTAVRASGDEAKIRAKYLLHQRKTVAMKELQKNLVGTISTGITGMIHMRADTCATGIIASEDEAKNRAKYLLHQRKTVAMKGRELQTNLVAALIGTITTGIKGMVHMRADTHATGIIASADEAKSQAYLH
jgi:hypothetical protein